MRRFMPWLRIIVSLPFGIVAIMLFHNLMTATLPRLYASELNNDKDRVLMLVLTVGAGIFGSFVVAAVAQHRLWLHMALFFLVMLAIDIQAIFGYLAQQPTWFKAIAILTLPLQAWIGGLLAKRAFKAYSSGRNKVAEVINSPLV